MHEPMHLKRTTRRRFLAGAGALAGGFGLLVSVRPSEATTEAMNDAIREVVGKAAVREGKIKLELPPLVENGNAVPLTVSVESPMTEAEHVRRIHLFNEKNPQPNVATFHLGPRSGRAGVSTRLRLADSQQLVAIAELSDGSFWKTTAHVIVTIAACTEELG
jgi:sulfur-oxidizing protein SoxY